MAANKPERPERPKKLSRADYTLGWICALPIELAASSGMLDEVHRDLALAQGDKNIYTLGEIGGHNIVMACLPAGNMGITPAATVAANMLRSFPKIRFSLLVGIGGGAPVRRARPSADIRLGDVVVSIPQGEIGGVVKYDRGKVVSGGEFKHTGLLNMPPTPLTNAVAKLRAIHETKRNAIGRNVKAMISRVMQAEDANPEFEDQYKCPDLKYDQLFEADYEHVEVQLEDEVSDDGSDLDEFPLPCRSCESTRLVPRKPRKSSDPIIHYGTIASADQVMRHGATRERIRKSYGVLCFEMEAAGLMNDFPCLVIRGICDYADSHKHKIWQRYAAATAAAYAKELLEVVLKEDIERTEDAVKVLQRDTDRQLREKILKWLGNDTHIRRFHDSYDKWQPCTAQKLMNDEQYSNWLNGKTKTLWCNGLAGGGKTVFASVVVHDLRVTQGNQTPETKSGVVCIFCDYEIQKDQDVRSLASAILRQLAEQCEVLPVSITNLFHRHQTNDVPLRHEEIWSALTDVAGKFSRVWLIVDALDECLEDTRRDLLSHLLELQQKCGINILATSRPTFNFQEEFGACEELKITADPEDVKRVLDILIEKANTLVKSDRELRQTVTEDIAQAVDGMFLLVEPFLDSIIGGWSKAEVKRALKALRDSTNKISMVYERALSRIASQKPVDRALAYRILSWIIQSKRPLTRQEFLHALAVVEKGTALDGEEMIADLDRAVALCAGLVAINQQSNTVQLMHHTTRKYFEDHKNSLDWMEDAHRMIATASLTYISYSVFDAGPCQNDEELEGRLSEYPFLEYAARYWGNHVHDGQTHGTKIQDLALSFLQNEAKVTSSNQVFHLTDYRPPEYSQQYVRGVDGLQIAASFGLVRIVEGLVEHGADTKAKDQNERTALHRAAENGHSDVVRVLVNHGAEGNAKESKYGQTPLHLAALNGHKDVVQILLEKGAEANFKDSDGWMAIHLAAWIGNEDAVRVLLKNAGVNGTGKDDVTALHCAAAQGHQTVVRLLIGEGADVDARDVNGWTPLHWASKKRHNIMQPRILTVENESSALLQQFLAYQENIMKVLPRQVPEIQHSSALLQQFLAHQENIMKVLPRQVPGIQDRLTAAEDALAFWQKNLAWLHSPEKEGAPTPARLVFELQDELTTLHCATECRHVPVAELLLQNGADIDKKCKAKVETGSAVKMGAGPTALHLAAFSGHEAMVRLLLGKHADIHTRSVVEADGKKDESLDAQSTTDAGGKKDEWLGAQWTALHWAVASGNEDVVQLLLGSSQYKGDIDHTCPVSLGSMYCELTPLHLAVILGHENVLRLLIFKEARVDARGETNLNLKVNKKTEGDEDSPAIITIRIGPTALHLAALLGRHNVLQVLLEKTTDVDTKLHVTMGETSLQLTPLHIAVLCKQTKAAQLLLQNRANVQSGLQVEKDGGIHAEILPLHLTAFANNRALAELLLTSRADVNAKCEIDGNASELVNPRATTERNRERTGEDPKATLHRVLGRTVDALLVFLGEEFADIPLVEKAAAIVEGHRERAYTMHAEFTPLHVATMCGNEEVMWVLLENAADTEAKFLVNINDASLELTALHLAGLWSHEGIIRYLLDTGADIHVKLQINIGSWLHIEVTVLHLAAMSGNEKVVQLLLDRGSDAGEICLVNGTDSTLRTVHLAAMCSHEGVVELLMENGADISTDCRIRIDPWLDIELTILHLAAMWGKMDTVRLLLESGSNAQTRGKLRCHQIYAEFTLQHLVAMWKDEDVIELLLQRNCEVNAKFRIDIGSWQHAEFTVLHTAVLFGNETILQRLLEAGADSKQRALMYGRLLRIELTVLHLATVSRKSDIVKRLIDVDDDMQEHFQMKVWDMRAQFSPLHLSLLWWNTGTVLSLLEKGFDADSKLLVEGQHTYMDLAALHLAAASAQKEMVQALLHHGANADARCRIEFADVTIDLSALHLAIAWRSGQMMQQLLSTEPLPRPSLDLGNARLDWGSNTSSRSHSRSRSQSQPIPRPREHSTESETREDISNDRLEESSEKYLNNGSTVGLVGNEAGSSQAPPNIDSFEDQSAHHLTERTSMADANATLQFTIGTTRVRIAGLHMAAILKSPQTIQTLLQGGAGVNMLLVVESEAVQIELTALHLAVLWASQAMIQQLLECEVDLEAMLRIEVKGMRVELSALHMAALHRSTGTAQFLLDHHADAQTRCQMSVRQRVRAELTVLHLIALSRDGNIAGLLNKGLAVNAKCLANVEFSLLSEPTALDIARVFNRHEMIELFASAGSNKDQDQGTSSTHVRLLALLLAAGLRKTAVAELILPFLNGVDETCSVKMQAQVETVFEIPMQPDAEVKFSTNVEVRLSALHLLAGLGNVVLLPTLLDQGASLEDKCHINVEGVMHIELSALHLSGMLNQDEAVQLLLEQGADKHAIAQVNIHRTLRANLIAPHIEALFELKGILRLLKTDVDVEIKIQAYPAALHFAALMDHVVVAMSLLEHGADVDANCLVRVEAKTKANMDAKIQLRLAALHFAAWAGHYKVMQLLLSRGADVNSAIKVEGGAADDVGARNSRKSKAGRTAMHLAAVRGHEEVVRILIDSGAELTIKDRDGRTPIQLAKHFGHDKLAQLMDEQLQNSRATKRGKLRRMFGGR